MTDQKPILEVSDLKVYFETASGLAKSVDGIKFKVYPGETLAVVGESGCGKSVTAMSILRLIPSPPAVFAGGAINFQGKDILKMSQDELRQIRGNKISMIFQEPMTSLNPVYTVGDQIIEAILVHQKNQTPKTARLLAIDALKQVGIPAPESRVDDYPHNMSGGMRQRVMIAMSLVCNPILLIADEPTTALDVTVQAQILELLKDLQSKSAMSILLITHDLGVVAETSDHVVVMYAGKVVEYAKVKPLFETPRHPYTIGLFESLPNLEKRVSKLATIPGMVPRPQDFPTGCRFRNRCKFADQNCEVEPPLYEISNDHWVACCKAETI